MLMMDEADETALIEWKYIYRKQNAVLYTLKEFVYHRRTSILRYHSNRKCVGASTQHANVKLAAKDDD